MGVWVWVGVEARKSRRDYAIFNTAVNGQA